MGILRRLCIPTVKKAVIQYERLKKVELLLLTLFLPYSYSFYSTYLFGSLLLGLSCTCVKQTNIVYGIW